MEIARARTDGARGASFRCVHFTLPELNALVPQHASRQSAPAFAIAGVCIFRCASAVFDQLGTQWQLCTQTDTSDGDHGSLAVFLHMVGNAISEPVAFALRVVAEDGDKVSRNGDQAPFGRVAGDTRPTPPLQPRHLPWLMLVMHCDADRSLLSV